MQELIRMCDCSEIQDKFNKPQRGDICVDFELIETLIVIDVHNNERVSVTTLVGDKDNVHPRNIIFIPRIEDVLEWLKDEQICLNNPQMWDGTHWCAERAPYCKENQPIEKYYFESDSPMEALLEAYMYELHNKTWTGKAWA